ncbi:3-isopropylmalate dehydrogenase [Mycobacterium sp. Root135]|uniref:3-isopropylmalate dehydrogenase n=1 Tax=Mycobacterium sp. Root135 TaxID=1736457 RepID=UPI0006F4E1FF|nr:3-isopropylmalate dehydrogenase [Mycobacterium sp. Root135]KQY08930.1 3-isopropylmalate dehydrogenase [Mycobacterium sp. Root135]
MHIGIIAGDGIGPEVIDEALKVLHAVRDDITYVKHDLGAQRYHRTGELLSEHDLDRLREHDALMLGAIGDPSVPSGILERGLLLKLRFALDHHVNLRPTRHSQGSSGPLRNDRPFDFVVVREGTEGPYVGNGGAIRTGTPHEIATEVSVNTRFGVDRVVRYAFDLATARGGEITWVHKTNVLTHAGSLWQRAIDSAAVEYPHVTVGYMHVDAATVHLVTAPERFDVILTDNLFGDIITDLAAAISGGIGLGASGNIDSTGANPSMFEPVHGSAPDIAGRGVADPRAAILSAAMMLRHLGSDDHADMIETAVADDVNADDGRPAGTKVIGDRIVKRIVG